MSDTQPTCGDTSCVFGHTGQGTNGGCRCIPLRLTPMDRVVLGARIRMLRSKLAQALASDTPPE